LDNSVNAIELEAYMLSKVFSKRKNGEITVELTLSVALTAVVLFLVLSLFSGNLQSMTANSGIRNLFNRNNTNGWGTTSKTKTEVNLENAIRTQVDTQVVAEQGLQYYVKKAEEVIKNYQTTPLPNADSAQKLELAKALTIAAVNHGQVLGTQANGQTVNWSSYYTTYGIRVTIYPSNNTYSTVVNGTIYKYNNSGSAIDGNSSQNNDNDDAKVKVIKDDILKW